MHFNMALLIIALFLVGVITYIIIAGITKTICEHALPDDSTAAFSRDSEDDCMMLGALWPFTIVGVVLHFILFKPILKPAWKLGSKIYEFPGACVRWVTKPRKAKLPKARIHKEAA